MEANPGKKLIFGFNHRHHPGITDAKAIIDSGTLGGIVTLRGVYGKGGGYDYPASWRNDPAVSGGGILLDQGIHMIDLFRYFGGEFHTVKAVAASRYWEVPVEDNAMVILQGSDGLLATLHSSATLWKHTFHCELGLSEGTIRIEGLLSKRYAMQRLENLAPLRNDESVRPGDPYRFQKGSNPYLDHLENWTNSEDTERGVMPPWQQAALDGPVFGGITTEMPLTDHAGLIAGRLEQLGNGDLRFRQTVGVPATQHCGPCRPAARGVVELGKA